MNKILLVLILLIGCNVSASISYNDPVSIDSRIKTFVYSPNEVFTVVFSQGYYSYIEFAKGEKIKNIAVGDASSWKISHSGNKLFVMPYESSSHSNMIITTTKKRNYIFDLISRPNFDKQVKSQEEVKTINDYSAARDISYIVRFYYPKTEDEFDIEGLDELSMPTQKQYIDEEQEEIIQENNTKYNYTYKNKEGNFNLAPVELFDDGYLTYFRFNNNNEIPQIFIENKSKIRVPCKRLLFDNHVIIKGVHRKLFLHYKDNQIEIVNKSK